MPFRPSSIKYAATFAALSSVCLGAAALVGQSYALPLLLLTAIAFFMVAAAYALRRPEVLGKHADGSLDPIRLVLLLPYHVLNHVTFALVRARHSSSPWCEMAPNLLLGRRLTSREAARLTASNVLDLTSEFAEPRALRRRHYLAVPMLDGTSPSATQLERAVAWLQATAPTGSTYVHCAMGDGRSATVVAAYLLAEGQASTVDHALELVKARRPGMRLSRGQRLLLDQFAQQKQRVSSPAAASPPRV